MTTETEIPEVLRNLMKKPNGNMGEIERLIIELNLSGEVTAFIHRQLATSLLPPEKQ